MKKIMMTALTLILASAVAVAGGKDRGGGNSLEIEFKGIGLTIVNELQSVPQFSTLGLNAVTFRSMVQDLEVIPSGALTLDGKKKEAINTPSKKQVQVDEENWNQLTDRRKQVLVMHEVLSLLGYQDEQQSYTLTSQFFSILDEPLVQTTLNANRHCKNEATAAALEKQKAVTPLFDPHYVVTKATAVSLPGVPEDLQTAGAFVVEFTNSSVSSKWLVIVSDQKLCSVSSVLKAM